MAQLKTITENGMPLSQIYAKSENTVCEIENISTIIFSEDNRSQTTELKKICKQLHYIIKNYNVIYGYVFFGAGVEPIFASVNQSGNSIIAKFRISKIFDIVNTDSEIVFEISDNDLSTERFHINIEAMPDDEEIVSIYYYPKTDTLEIISLALEDDFEHQYNFTKLGGMFKRNVFNNKITIN